MDNTSTPTGTTAPPPPAPAPAGLALLRQPVPEHLISPLPKGTKAQNECPADQKITCRVCGGWHHPQVRHLDYVGHAAATHLLLDADPKWDWAPLAYTEAGLPKFDESGGLWIKLTVCGVTRLGYGHAERKQQMDIGSREKEVIGDAIRNAAMRFGLALDLWSKADLHAELHGDGDDAGQGQGAAGNGYHREPEVSQTPPPVASAPARRSAASARSNGAARHGAATGHNGAASGNGAASANTGISEGQLKNLQIKIKSLGLDTERLDQLLAKVGVHAIGPSMSLADWAAVKRELDAAARAM